MKPHIHPNYDYVVFRDMTSGYMFLTRSTATSNKTVTWTDGKDYPLIDVDTTSDTHPFWTGTARILDSEGRVQAFERRYGKKSS
jgi:large subunit ribosomal protein L31